MKDEVFDALTRWGELGHTIQLVYGETRLGVENAPPVIGWVCYIRERFIGSFSYASLTQPPPGFHPTSAHEAARIALRHAAERWPAMAERAQP